VVNAAATQNNNNAKDMADKVTHLIPEQTENLNRR